MATTVKHAMPSAKNKQKLADRKLHPSCTIKGS